MRSHVSLAQQNRGVDQLSKVSRSQLLFGPGAKGLNSFAREDRDMGALEAFCDRRVDKTQAPLKINAFKAANCHHKPEM